MPSARPVGRQAASRKYDLLTAMGAFALGLDKTAQRMVLRLMTLITARYNWARDELAVGQREIARLWSCDERTVKREMAKLRARGWLVVRRQGARGRVTEYGLAIERILDDTRASWDRIGPDFGLRVDAADATDRPGGGNIVPMTPRGAVPPPPDVSDGSEWALAQAVLHGEDPGLYAAWIAPLARAGRAGGRLSLTAPSRFHAAYVGTHLRPRLLAACQAVDDGVSDIVLLA